MRYDSKFEDTIFPRRRSWNPDDNRSDAHHCPAVGRGAKTQATARMSKRPIANKKQHRFVLRVNTNETAVINLALNNATNNRTYYPIA